MWTERRGNNLEDVMSIDEIGFEIEEQEAQDLGGYYWHGVGFITDDGDTIKRKTK